MILSGVRCAGCGADDLIAIAPGDEPERLSAGGFVIKRGTEDRGWCATCWPWSPRETLDAEHVSA